ncbi:MAG: diguanylate cyclase [Nitrospirae bacterium]|nr:diguanylate cyclase [Nitrospirota bacterium]
MYHLPSHWFVSFRHWSVSAKLIAILAPVLLVFLFALVWVFPGRHREQMVEQQVTAMAKAVLTQIQADREYYASVIVPRLLNMNAKIKADYHLIPDAFPLPATFLREVAEMAAYSPSVYRIRLVSPWPINKKNGIQDAFQQEGFQALLQTKSGLYSQRDSQAGTTVVRFLAPDKAVAQSCVDCHNAHPDSPKHDYHLNDLMGGIEVSIPIDAPLKAARRDQLLILWAGAGVGLLLMAMIVWGTRHVATKPIRELTNQMNAIALAKGEVSEVPEFKKWAETAMGEEVRALWSQFWEMHKTIRMNQQDRTVALQRQSEKHRVLNHRLLELQQVTQVMQQATSEEEVYRILSHTLRQVLPLRQILILRLNASEDRLELVWSSPKRDEYGLNSYPVWDQPWNCPVIRSGREYRVQDVKQDLTCSYSLSNEEEGAYWCVPLVIGGRAIGVVHLVSAVPQCWTQDSRQWIEPLINMAAPMIGHLQHLEKAKRRALIDELTGVYNRRFLEEVLDKLILPEERRKGQIVSLLILDLDHFKRVNDTFGHLVGDLVLKTVAATLHRILKESDVLARYGGEEFIVVLPRTDTGAAVVVAERLRVAIADLSFGKLAPAAPDHVTISVGVATYPTHASTVSDLIRSADQALYQAKTSGRNRVICTSDNRAVVSDPPTEGHEDR